MSPISLSVIVLTGCVMMAPLGAQDRESAPEASPAQTVSADVLRIHLSDKTRHMVELAVKWVRSARHREAIQQLEATLAKDSASAPYVQSLLGYEYLKTNQFAAASNSLEQAVALLPHDAINHSNFAISLAATGDLKRAEEEAHRAIDLDPKNPVIRNFLEALQANQVSFDAPDESAR